MNSKLKLTYLVALLGLLTLYTTVSVSKTHTKGKIEWIGKYDKKARKTGFWVFYSENGSQSIKANYLKGELHGTYASFYANGKKKQRSYYINNLLDGKYGIFYDNADNSPAVRGTYHKGNKSGSWSRWSLDNELVTNIHYSKGLKHGLYTSFVNGRKYQEFNYRHGLLEGISRHYSIDTKKVILQGRFIKSKQHGVWKSWTSNGLYQKTISRYTRGKLNGKHIQFNENGQKWKVWTYKRNILQGPYIEYFGDKKMTVFLEGTYKKGKRIGSWRYFYKNSTLWKNVQHQNDNKHGHHIQYYRSGRLWKKSKYYNDKLQGPFIQYTDRYKSPRLLTGQYRNNQRHDKWIQRYVNGKNIYKVSFYKKGLLHGTVTQYYPNGRRWSTSQYSENLRTGIYLEFHDNVISSKKIRGHYKNDSPTGTWTTWTYKGKVIKRKNRTQ